MSEVDQINRELGELSEKKRALFAHIASDVKRVMLDLHECGGIAQPCERNLHARMDDRRGGLNDDVERVAIAIYEPTEAQERGLRQKGKPDRGGHQWPGSSSATVETTPDKQNCNVDNLTATYPTKGAGPPRGRGAMGPLTARPARAILPSSPAEGSTMRRREFISLVGGAAAWPVAALGQRPEQRPTTPVIGFLGSGGQYVSTLLSAFKKGLSDGGYEEGRNVAIEYRWAEGRYDRLPALAADLIRRQVSVIVATTVASKAAKTATATIPIVFTTAGDPVEEGLVASLNRPGGNATGLTLFYGTLDAKRLQLLHDLIPTARTVAMLVKQGNTSIDPAIRDANAAVRSLGQILHVLSVDSASDFETAFSTMVNQGTQALIVGADPFFFSQRGELVTVAARHRIPAIYTVREFAEAGGLMSYAASLRDAMRQVGEYAGRILKGEKPADLPVLQPTKFELVINLKTAKALGIDVSPMMLARADEVIE
jgi:putative ABC transport system substrate-binding protein